MTPDSSSLLGDDAQQDANSSFGQSLVIEPKFNHTHTAIVLHGRGSDAEEFCDELLESTLSGGRTLCDNLPNWRWVFPCSKEIWSTAFEENMPAWFEAHSLTDPTIRQDLQVNGLVDSMGHVSSIIKEEVERLGGDARKVALGGISQGGALGLWALLSRRGTPLGAFFAASTWLPFAADLKNHYEGRAALPSTMPGNCEPRDVVLALLPPANGKGTSELARETMVFLGHGRDDAFVDEELGREACRFLRDCGFSVEWKGYEGAEQEGHWFKVPDEMDDIHTFLVRAMPG